MDVLTRTELQALLGQDRPPCVSLFMPTQRGGGAEVPLRQDVAVTGSVNQHGEVQAVGGVNEKVEGFFEVCRLRGLTGTQGVCLPRANVRHWCCGRTWSRRCARGSSTSGPSTRWMRGSSC